jgi:hypothetical protein
MPESRRRKKEKSNVAIIVIVVLVLLGFRDASAVQFSAKQSTVLLPKAPRQRSRRNKGWKLYVNANVEVEL